MTETMILTAERRIKNGTRATRKEREAGRTPAIIYGHKKEPVSISLNSHDLMMELHRHHRLLSVKLDGKDEQYLLKSVQYDHMGDHIIHIDLARVDMNERVRVTVEVTLRGEPKGAHEGGVLTQILTDLEMECLVTAIPEMIRVNVSHMGVGETMTAGQVELPAGAKLITAADTPVAIVRTVIEAPTAEPAAEGEATSAEPEVIKREKPEDAEEE